MLPDCAMRNRLLSFSDIYIAYTPSRIRIQTIRRISRFQPNSKLNVCCTAKLNQSISQNDHLFAPLCNPAPITAHKQTLSQAKNVIQVHLKPNTSCELFHYIIFKILYIETLFFGKLRRAISHHRTIHSQSDLTFADESSICMNITWSVT